MLSTSYSKAYHFTLAHKHNSITMRTNMWTFPERRNKRATKIASNVAKAPSRMRRKVGFRDDPGLSKPEKKLSSISSVDSGVDITIIAICVDKF